MSRGPDAATLLERALKASAAVAGCAVTIAESTVQRWASATFMGTRHTMTLARAPSPQFDAWLAALPEAEFALRGHLVADLQVMRVTRDDGAVSVELEILTVEER
ncbi:MAG: hypothetical protein KF730_04045 [Sphingomonas sp.]|uniref:hypothetical protein n=1 Tax=Sphingomonas sp. TaxID=28214 RepID=UPI0025EA1515|nr:hypothetical protein [Sphingomonas sp.]MBX3563731.1 hypothetical protein [Sphingomonas sp.]